LLLTDEDGMMSKPADDKLGHAKREIKALRVQVAHLRTQLAEANTKRDSAMDEAVVAWGELEAVRARAAEIDRMRNAQSGQGRLGDYSGDV
jgi:uncharacterized protein (DUF3084 family)